ncbi:alanine racemase [Trueperella bonasi]|uniref:Alanine racemase n=1 Tax=Trueperella bonasi TaxID=312286 RepID=A0ABT9NEU0_9ACTO|nr:alanine racemase [Trueperella bonasi]MDP9805859.1 alanine racemase [Trueperella bonasi]
MTSFPARALISRSALSQNLAVLRASTSSELMAILKADAYGHGLERIARWAFDDGVRWFGVAQLTEAMQLREHLPSARILTWIFTPGTDLSAALRADIDLSIGAAWALDDVEAAAHATGLTARIHVKVDTGMSRGGLMLADVAKASARIAELEAEGVVSVVGLWSHLACADELPAPGQSTNGKTETQIAVFEQARAALARAGVTPHILHLAASAGVLWHPAAHYDLVRPGIALYGISPNPAVQRASELGLRGLMQLEAGIFSVRDVPAGTGVSYGHTYVTGRPARLGVVPLGYADGVPRLASNAINVRVGGQMCPIRGRVCMDQFVIEGTGLEAGQTAILLGDERNGLPTADDWAAATHTIGYEIVTRIGRHVPRVDAS